VLRKASEVYVALKASKVYVALTKGWSNYGLKFISRHISINKKKSASAKKKTSCSSKEKQL